MQLPSNVPAATVQTLLPGPCMTKLSWSCMMKLQGMHDEIASFTQLHDEIASSMHDEIARFTHDEIAFA